jgi:hypothetical protein
MHSTPSCTVYTEIVAHRSPQPRTPLLPPTIKTHLQATAILVQTTATTRPRHTVEAVGDVCDARRTLPATRIHAQTKNPFESLPSTFLLLFFCQTALILRQPPPHPVPRPQHRHAALEGHAQTRILLPSVLSAGPQLVQCLRQRRAWNGST